MSNILPSDITKSGILKKDVWLTGNIVRIRERKPQETKQQGQEKAKGKNKNKNKSKQMQARTPNQGFEIHVCAGTTPADVILVETWESSVITKLKQVANKREAVAFTNVLIKAHTDKTSPWTTSRLPFFGVLPTESEFKKHEENADWLKYHPLTTMADLQYLSRRHTRVCRRTRDGSQARKSRSQHSL